MKQIINDKLYDTEKAEKIYSFQRKVDKGAFFWDARFRHTPYHLFEIYKTSKDSYFEYDTEDKKVYPVDEDAVKNIIKPLNADKFMELFNVKIDEA